MLRIAIINGPNLNLLGQREVELYGTDNFKDYLLYLRNKYDKLDIEYYQSNSEGEIIDKLQASNDICQGIILNAGAYTHYSYAIRDAISSIKTDVIEVHITNIYKRELFRQKSVISAVCLGTISGFGLKSYDLALTSFL